jgi:hypothetical protein
VVYTTSFAVVYTTSFAVVYTTSFAVVYTYYIATWFCMNVFRVKRACAGCILCGV